ncbi:LptF/LptG family permease [Bacteriovoracaceae bacterium]|nr:LptF/LptG family permease [Bacteriovoracaceae bacterium]
MPIIPIYISANFILPLLVSTLFFVIFLLTFEMLKLVQFMGQKDLSILFVFELVSDIAISFLPLALPISLYFSTIYCVGKFCNDSEFVAFKSIGLNKHSLIAPFLIVSILSAGNLLFLNQQLIPNANRSMREKVDMLASASLIQGLKEGQFFTRLKNITLFPLKISEDQKNMDDVFLHLFTFDKEAKERIIIADKGILDYTQDKENKIESINLTLKDGNIIHMNESGETIEKIRFEEYSFPLKSKKSTWFTRTRETMMNFFELRKLIDDGAVEAKKIGFSKRDYFNAQYEFYNRLVSPLLCIVLTILGFVFGHKNLRGGNKGHMLKAILFLIFYFSLYFSSISTARTNSIPIQYLIFIPIILLLGVSIYSYRKMDWV